MTTLRPLLRLTAVLVPAALLAPVAAHAERVVVRDPGRDAVRIDQAASEEAGTEVAVAAPRETSTDITRVVVDHGADELRIVVQVRDLDQRFLEGADVRLRTPQWRWGVTVLRSGRETFTALTRGARESDRTCGGLVTTVDTRADRLVVTVPTSCLEDPRWVRAGVALFSENVRQGSLDEADLFWDEAGVRGFEDDHVEVRGPKVHRG